MIRYKKVARTSMLVMLVFNSFLFVACTSSTRADKLERSGQAKVSGDKIAQVATPPSATPQFTDQSGITVVYPRADKVPAASTYIAGAVNKGSSLTCNGAPVRVSPEGYFAHVISLKPGVNSVTLQEQPSGRSREIKIEREVPVAAIAAGGCKIDAGSLQPKSDRGIVSGDTIELSARATPGSELFVLIGKRKISLHAPAGGGSVTRKRRKKSSAGSSSHVNRGLDAAYGKVYQRSAAAPGDLYVGSYKVQPDDSWNGARVRYVLKSLSKSTSSLSDGKLTTLAQPTFAETSHDKTIVRVGPGLGRITPLPKGVRVLIDGWQDDSMRCLYAPNHHYWIKREDLFQDQSQQSDSAPSSVARTINIGADDYGATVTVPLSQKLPFLIEQQMKPSRLVMRIFGVTADTDWITPAPPTDHPQLVDTVAWKQVGDGIYEVSVQLKSGSQWGFKADYNDANLVLHIKAPPKLQANGNRLQGLKICVDPGHGGNESGAIGCSGLREADMNLGISLKLKTLLEAAGAQVTMTRSDNREVSLDERVDIAEAANVDILLSVHNNSLPDGRDPWTEHGTSTYWYHPQATQLARLFKNDIVKQIGFPDFGSRFQNLALTRPSGMLAVLTETGFVVNPDEYAQLISDSGQEKAAQGMLASLIEYLGRGPSVKGVVKHSGAAAQ